MTQADEQGEYRIIAEFYDHIVPYRTRQDVDFFVEIAREAKGPVLEIGCGTGRVLIPTARAGVEIVGLDISQPMLDHCRKNLENEPKEVQARVQLVQGDMRHFHIGREFALATTPFRPFQHIMTVDDQIAVLRCIHSHLADGGRLVLDLFNPDLTRLADEAYLKYQDVEPEFTMPDGRKVLRTARNLGRNLLDQTVDIELAHHVTHPDGREEVLSEPLRLRYFFRFEVEHLLARAGFVVDQIYADYDRSPLGSKYPGELIFVARKV
jgi:SAM-dependent methyltransferase